MKTEKPILRYRESEQDDGIYAPAWILAICLGGALWAVMVAGLAWVLGWSW